jgi:hypothetical protein
MTCLVVCQANLNGRLVARSTLNSSTPHPGRYRLNDLMWLFSRERAITDEDEPNRQAALDRVLRRSTGDGPPS